MSLPSEWGVENATLVSPDPPDPGPLLPSEWGTANAALVSPDPPGGWGASAWGAADATLVTPSAPAISPFLLWDPIAEEYRLADVLAWVDGTYVPAERVDA